MSRNDLINFTLNFLSTLLNLQFIYLDACHNKNCSGKGTCETAGFSKTNSKDPEPLPPALRSENPEVREDYTCSCNPGYIGKDCEIGLL